MANNFSEAAKKVLGRAELEARDLHHEYVGTEHILLGLIQIGSAIVIDAFKTLGIAAAEVRQEIERLAQRGPKRIATGALPMTTRAQRAIEFACDEAAFMNVPSIDPEHLLLGLYREREGVAPRVLQNLGQHIGQVIEGVFRNFRERMQLVERAVGPVPAGTAWKQDAREELFAHLTAIYSEEYERLHNPAAAMKEAASRFGDPSELAQELAAVLPVSERRRRYVENWFGWLAPESAAQFMFRQSLQSFIILAVVCFVSIGATAYFSGWRGVSWEIVRTTAAVLTFMPTVQFVLGLLYYKTRDALYGPIWSSKSLSRVILCILLIIAVTFIGGISFVATTTWNCARVAQSLLPMCAIALVVAATEYELAQYRGLREIRETLWACLNTK